MARRNVDIQKLIQMREKIAEFEKNDADAFCERVAKEIASRLLRRVKQKTPVGVVPAYATPEAKAQYWSAYKGGELRDNWKLKEVRSAGKRSFEIEIFNPLEYASYVEYGHRQQAGRYVPQLGLKLKSGWVEGRHMLRISEEEIQRIAPQLLEKRLNEELQRLFNDGQ